MDKVADIFSETADQELAELFDGISNCKLSARSRHAVELLRERLRKLEIALAQLGPGLTVYNDLAYAHEYTNYALDTLETYFQNIEAGAQTPLEPRGAHIFAVYVSDQIMEIRFMAQELDAGH